MYNKNVPIRRDNLYIFEVDDKIRSDVFHRMLDICDEKKRQKIYKYRFDIDKKLSLYSEALLRYLAGKELGYDSAQLHIEKHPHGKPYFVGHDEFQYNISHTKNAVAIIYSDQVIGVDIERVGSLDLKIANRFFTKAEYDYIVSGKSPLPFHQSSLDDSKYSRFYEVWTRKEAYIKWEGTGLAIPLNSFNTLEEEINQYSATIPWNDYIVSIYTEKYFNKKNITILKESDIEKLFYY